MSHFSCWKLFKEPRLLCREVWMSQTWWWMLQAEMKTATAARVADIQLPRLVLWPFRAPRPHVASCLCDCDIPPGWFLFASDNVPHPPIRHTVSFSFGNLCVFFIRHCFYEGRRQAALTSRTKRRWQTCRISSHLLSDIHHNSDANEQIATTVNVFEIWSHFIPAHSASSPGNFTHHQKRHTTPWVLS